MILLTNDDGIDAPGLAALKDATGGHPTIVVAPLAPMSECSHRVTTKKPLRVERLGEMRFAVDGTPADCVRIGLLHLLPAIGKSPGRVRVFSGINAGGNLGADVYLSGTVAAVREAAFHGVPGVAFSQYRQGEPEEADWARSRNFARRVIEALWEKRLSPGEFWNVNFPWRAQEEPAIVFCERSRRPLPVKYDQVEGNLHYVAGLYHSREYEPGSDIAVCFSGRLSVTRMAL